MWLIFCVLSQLFEMYVIPATSFVYYNVIQYNGTTIMYLYEYVKFFALH